MARPIAITTTFVFKQSTFHDCNITSTTSLVLDTNMLICNGYPQRLVHVALNIKVLLVSYLETNVYIWYFKIPQIFVDFQTKTENRKTQNKYTNIQITPKNSKQIFKSATSPGTHCLLRKSCYTIVSTPIIGYTSSF